jgi:hypothetical protein
LLDQGQEFFSDQFGPVEPEFLWVFLEVGFVSD